jgi:hypothetical protein
MGRDRCPRPKDHINIRGDHDLLEWFMASGRGLSNPYEQCASRFRTGEAAGLYFKMKIKGGGRSSAGNDNVRFGTCPKRPLLAHLVSEEGVSQIKRPADLTVEVWLIDVTPLPVFRTWRGGRRCPSSVTLAPSKTERR